MKRFLATFLMIGMVGGSGLFSQTILLTETLDYLNKKFKDKCQFIDKKKYILVAFYKNGEEFRTDKIYIQNMDYESIEYSEEEKGIVINCTSKNEGCIQRKIPHLKLVDNYSRILFTLDGGLMKDKDAIIDALTHMIKLAYFSDINRTEPFE